MVKFYEESTKFMNQPAVEHKRYEDKTQEEIEDDIKYKRKK